MKPWIDHSVSFCTIWDSDSELIGFQLKKLGTVRTLIKWSEHRKFLSETCQSFRFRSDKWAFNPRKFQDSFESFLLNSKYAEIAKHARWMALNGYYPAASTHRMCLVINSDSLLKHFKCRFGTAEVWFNQIAANRKMTNRIWSKDSPKFNTFYFVVVNHNLWS